MATNRTVGLVAAAFSACLLFTGCGSDGAATPAGGGSANQQPMKETQTPMQRQERQMRGGGDEPGQRDEMHEQSPMHNGRDRMRGDDPMKGNERQQMQRGKHDSM
jgi:hypothetical protein